MKKTNEEKEPSDLQWASDVMIAYRNLGKIITTKTLEGSSSAKFLWDWASNPENSDKFITQTVPKATDILARHRKVEQDDQIIEVERKTILDLKLRLLEAIEEASEASY